MTSTRLVIPPFPVDDRMQSRLLLDAIVTTVDCQTRRLVFKHQG